MSLTLGQELVLRDFLSVFVPHEDFDPHRDMLMTSVDIAFELKDMCDYELNDISDYMVEHGYRYFRFRGSSMHGWVLEKVVEDIELE